MVGIYFDNMHFTKLSVRTHSWSWMVMKKISNNVTTTKSGKQKAHKKTRIYNT
jgi:hypothetical protein